MEQDSGRAWRRACWRVQAAVDALPEGSRVEDVAGGGIVGRCGRLGEGVAGDCGSPMLEVSGTEEVVEEIRLSVSSPSDGSFTLEVMTDSEVGESGRLPWDG